MTGTALLIVAGTIAAMAFNPFKAMKRARMAEAMTHGRMVKLAMDGFAMDNDGVYPSADTLESFGLPKDAKWSNDLFRQLFASGSIDNERIFWVKGAMVCNATEPDGVTTKDGKFNAGETLAAGDCGWAYIREQTNTDNPVRPILFDACKPGGADFDARLWGGTVIVIRIDGSAKAMPLDPNGALLDNGENILTAKAAMWKPGGGDPAKLLMQPEPSRAEVPAKPAEQKPAAPAQDQPPQE